MKCNKAIHRVTITLLILVLHYLILGEKLGGYGNYLVPFFVPSLACYHSSNPSPAIAIYHFPMLFVEVNICYRFPIELSCHLAADDTNDLTDYTDPHRKSKLSTRSPKKLPDRRGAEPYFHAWQRGLTESKYSFMCCIYFVRRAFKRLAPTNSV